MTKLHPDLEPLIDAAIAVARSRLEAGDELPGIAFIDAPHRSAGLVVVPMVMMPTKDAWARMVRTLSSFVEARFVMVVSEVWHHGSDSEGEVDRLMQLHGEVRLIPGRREGVLVQVETHDGLWQGIADLVPLAVARKPGCKTFGAIELRMPQRNEGRLVGLLGGRRGERQ